jgi:outer membrane protein assembly factor BamA
VSGGQTHAFGLALIWDTLDFEPYPSRGDYHEVFFSVANRKFTGSDYDFTRTTYTYRKYISLHRRLIFAHRTLLEYVGGDVPFFEMGNIGGTYNSQALGGDRFLRGYEGNRFMDKLRLVLGFELRWDPLFVNFLRQDLTIGFVPFIDIGRVWPDIIPNEWTTWHASGGWGTRLIWNSRLVIRLDTAFTPDGLRIVGNIGNSF